MTSATTQAVVLTHHFAFDSPSVVDSVGTATGTLVNGATIAGGHLVLDGFNDYSELNQQIVPTDGSAFSVTLFAQQASVQIGNYVEIISQGVSGLYGFYIGHNPNRKIRLTDQNLNTNIDFPSDGLFHLYTLTSGSGSGTQFYIDSTLAFTNALQLNPQSGGTNTRFGKQFVPFSEYFHGSIDDARVYDGVLSSNDVSALRTSFDTAVPEPTTLALLGFGIMGIGYGRRKSK